MTDHQEHVTVRDAACKTLPNGCDNIHLRTRIPWSCCTGEGTEDMYFIPMLKMRKLKRREVKGFALYHTARK